MNDYPPNTPNTLKKKFLLASFRVLGLPCENSITPASRMTPSDDLARVSWPIERLGEAMVLLARGKGFPLTSAEIPSPPPDLQHSEILDQWIDAVAGRLGFEAEPIETPYSEFDGVLRGSGPALLRLPGKTEARFLALIAGSTKSALVIGPDAKVHRVPLQSVRAEVCHELEAPLVAKLNRMMERARVARRRRTQTAAAILAKQLSSKRISDCWLLRLPSGAKWPGHARQAGLLRQLIAFLAGQAGYDALWVLSWFMIGKGALQGRLDPGWILAWALVLLGTVPLRMLATWSGGRLAMGAGAILKPRLLYGVLRLEPEEIRHQGAGQLLGSVIESEAVESMALSGGFLGLVSTLELLLAAVILGFGAGGWLHALILPAWCGMTFFLAAKYWRQRRQWTRARLDMTNDLVERMVGHRTRLAQELRPHWHDGEDQSVEDYGNTSAKMDRSAAWMMAMVPRGWLVAGLLGIVPAFVSGSGSPTTLAVSLGGILLAFRALQKLATGLWHIAGAAIAWKQVAPIFQAAARREPGGSPGSLVASKSPAPGSTGKQCLVEAHDLVFRFQDRGEAVLRGCNLRINFGDRLLLEGPSGGGKSTLASLLTGLRTPESGLLLLEGMDRHTWGGQNWRRRVAAAPQFHENHVLTGTFAFNLLLGRRWPPAEEDFQKAEALCRELGLEALLQRMPAGLLQMVGETGWQLSHGEKSRLYIARALLQGAELIILDESFASLDPENMRCALNCVLARASTLVVIAHP